ncbi:MAG: hypothetical protein IJS67_01265, partial [Clostridia bacterium]|nr:hypothetical protein [Clostridia bacterium]
REKNGWTGDISCSAEQLACNFHPEKSLAAWLKCARAEQTESGNIPSIIPTTGWGYDKYNGPAWASALVDAPYYIYKYTGDKKILSDNFDAIMKLCRYEAEQIRDDGLLGYGLGDWAQPRHPVGRPETPNDITDTLTVIDQCEKIKQMATVLGRKGDSVYAENLARRLKDSFRKIYIEGGKIKEPFASQTAIAMSIRCKVFDKSEIPLAVEQLVANIRSKDDHFDTGVLGSKVLYRVLSENGYADLAYRLITRDTFPSYAEQMSHGATALWECFVEVDKGENVASLNHHFWGDISAWFFRCLVGLNINPDLKDPYLIEVSPKFVKGITFAKAEREYMGEKICVEWVFENGEYNVRIHAPAKFRVVRV